MRGNTLGCFIAGDFNVHSETWLRHSTGESTEGHSLRNICRRQGLQQLIEKPTKGDNLLDLVLTDVTGVKYEITSELGDHSAILYHSNIKVPRTATIKRPRWQYHKADWDGLKTTLNSIRWEILDRMDADNGAQWLTSKILDAAKDHIPLSTRRFTKKSHPWLTNSIVEAIQAKKTATTSEQRRSAQKSCDQAILKGLHSFIIKTKLDLAKIKPGSKKWWKKSKELVGNRVGISQIPVLRHPNGT